ncbi:MAG: septum formation inhibitor Maf, partial [Bacteroidota bacterium]
TAKLTDNGTLNSYEVHYPELKRTLVINYTKDFPYTIESWSEIARSGFGPNAKLLTSTAKKISSIKTAYWGQNGNDDLHLRDSLGL